ncbi:MAG: hypothetical protein M1823_005283 [Watsoniomyces obsoletus]|nr:MAG: hypothetical protein M1823_005283 [Watsoniomyces obsoletus]
MMAPPSSTVASAFASPGTGPVLDIASHLASLVETDIESLATAANTVDWGHESDADYNSNTTSGDDISREPSEIRSIQDAEDALINSLPQASSKGTVWDSDESVDNCLDVLVGNYLPRALDHQVPTTTKGKQKAKDSPNDVARQTTSGQAAWQDRTSDLAYMARCALSYMEDQERKRRMAVNQSTKGPNVNPKGPQMAVDQSTKGLKLNPKAPEDYPNDPKTLEQYRKILTSTVIPKMMFVSGETAEPSAETAGIVEEIVRSQVIEMLRESTALAARRGSRSITTDDLFFLIRHDKAKVSRLRVFLSWKDVRKNVRSSDDKGGGDAADLGVGEDPGATDAVANGPLPDGAKKAKKAKIRLPWDVSSYFQEQVPEREDEEDEEEEEMNQATLERLRKADERTKDMTREEYVNWSECRQASFTFRKAKRFREWAGFGTVTDSKPNDDIVDILGFLTYEIVQTLTEEGLKVKEEEDRRKRDSGGGGAGAGSGQGESSKKRKREGGLFNHQEEGREPLQPRHIREAFRRLQQHHPANRKMAVFAPSWKKRPLRLI